MGRILVEIPTRTQLSNLTLNHRHNPRSKFRKEIGPSCLGEIASQIQHVERLRLDYAHLLQGEP